MQHHHVEENCACLESNVPVAGLHVFHTNEDPSQFPKAVPEI